METKFKRYLHSFCAAIVFAATPLASHAIPITYELGAGSAPGFSATWLQAATNEMGNTGYYTNGQKAAMTGSLTLDMNNLGSASGSLTGSGDFGQGADIWTIDFAGASSNAITFADGNTDLLSLNYTLTNDGNTFSSTGIFYFANRDFNGASDGPNSIDPSVLYLWGNNWINDGIANDPNNYVDDRDDFVNCISSPGPVTGIQLVAQTTCSNVALGLDLYGVAVPEPGIALLLTIGLLGMGFKRRFQSA